MIGIFKSALLRGYGFFVISRTGFRKLLRRFYPNQHQLTSVTSANRYPELFLESVKATPKNVHPKILSYGCSSGEECFTLADYFPQSQIVGVDINKANLRKANRRNSRGGIKFLLSSDENIRAEGPYDLIYALSVLCRWDDTRYVTNCEQIYPFSKYEETVSSLVANLKINGLLIIYNSNFRFEDTRMFSCFEIVETLSVENSGFVYKFDAHNELIDQPHRGCIYRKKILR